MCIVVTAMHAQHPTRKVSARAHVMSSFARHTCTNFGPACGHTQARTFTTSAHAPTGSCWYGETCKLKLSNEETMLQGGVYGGECGVVSMVRGIEQCAACGLRPAGNLISADPIGNRQIQFCLYSKNQ